MGVLVDDGPLSKVRLASGANGDGTSADVPEDSRAAFAFFCSMRKAKSLATGSARRSVLPVLLLIGIRLHPTFFFLHLRQGPVGTT